MNNRLARGGSDPRSETERRLGVAGTIELQYPTPRPAGFFGDRHVPSEFCSGRCSADGCEVTGYVPATAYEAFDRGGVRYVVRCSKHAEERAARLDVRREHFEDDARDAALDDAYRNGR